MLTNTTDIRLLSKGQDLIRQLGDNWRKRVREHSSLDVDVKTGKGTQKREKSASSVA